ncbi:MAG: endosialidase [Lachnospiraceae bacterium]|nr:endosialidase [Lachnospiraceae bacterium]
MLVISSLIQNETDGTLSFGDFSQTSKQKKSDFKHENDLYKVKTFNEITKLEKNEAFVYESVPGTSVFNFTADENKVSFSVAGKGDAQITLELEAEKEYEVFVEKESLGVMKTNLGGKLIFSAELDENVKKAVEIIKK